MFSYIPLKWKILSTSSAPEFQDSLLLSHVLDELLCFSLHGLLSPPPSTLSSHHGHQYMEVTLQRVGVDHLSFQLSQGLHRSGTKSAVSWSWTTSVQIPVPLGTRSLMSGQLTSPSLGFLTCYMVT